MEHMSYIFGSFARRRQSEEPKGVPKGRSVAQAPPVPSPVVAEHRQRALVPLVEGSFQCAVCQHQLVEPRVLPCLHTFCTRCLLPLAKSAALYASPHSQSQASLHEMERAKPGNGNGGSGAGEGVSGSLNGSGGSGGSGYESEPSSWSSSDNSRHNRQVIVCPSCSTESKLPTQGVQGLPVHYIIQNRIIHTLQQAATCDLCATDVQASSRCQDCLISMCSFCSEAHQRQRASAMHDIISLKDTADAALVRRQVMCVTHPCREVRLFCGRCGVVACRDCCVSLHRGHPCDTAARAARHYAATLREALDRTRPLAKEAAHNLDRLHHLEQRIQSRCTEVESEVERFAESYKAALEEHRESLRREIAQVRHNKLSALHGQHGALQQRAEHASHAVSFTQDVLAEASDLELLSLVSPVLRRLEWCCSVGPFKDQPNVTDCLQFLPEERAGTLQSHPVFGVVTTQSVSPYHCVLGTEGLLNCRQHKKAEFVLVTKDCDQQPVCHGGEPVSAELRYRDGTQRQLPVHVKDRGDGTYGLFFTPDTSGNLSLIVSVQHIQIQGSPFNVSVSTLRPHPGVYHCCTFCSSNGNKNASCGCGGQMPGGYRGCGHGHTGHPGRRHWSCCGNLLHNSECSRSTVYQFTL